MRSIVMIFFGLILVVMLMVLRFVLERRPDRPIGTVIFNFFIGAWFLFCLLDMSLLVWLEERSLIRQLFLHLIILVIPLVASWYLLHKRESRLD